MQTILYGPLTKSASCAIMKGENGEEEDINFEATTNSLMTATKAKTMATRTITRTRI